MNDVPVPLSPHGQKRREEILRLAIAQAQSRRRRRHLLPAAIACAVMALGVGQALRWHRTSPALPIAIVPAPVLLPVVPAPRPRVVVQWIRTDAALLDRLRVRPDPLTVPRLSDDQLLERLTDAGHPAGLAYVENRVLVLYRSPSVHNTSPR